MRGIRIAVLCNMIFDKMPLEVNGGEGLSCVLTGGRALGQKEQPVMAPRK